jgi:hypothetical protein
MDEALVQSFFDLWELGYLAGAVKNMRLLDYHIMLSLAILTAMLWNHMREELGEAMSQLRFFLVNVDNGRCINISTRPSRELSLPSVCTGLTLASKSLAYPAMSLISGWQSRRACRTMGPLAWLGPFPGATLQPCIIRR